MRLAHLEIATLIATTFVATLTTPALADQQYHASRAELRPTAWAFGADNFGDLDGEPILLGIAGVGLLINWPHLLPQNRPNVSPDAPHSWNSFWSYDSYITAFGAGAIGIAHYFLRTESLHDAKVESPYLAALPVLLADVEAAGIGLGVTQLVKTRVGRCRPYVWRDNQCVSNNDDDFAAFPSGHTMVPSALAGVHLVEVVRDSKSTVNWFSFIGLELAAVSTGIMRVKAGAHSPSDVVGGYAIGHLTGVAVALMHPRASVEKPPDGFGIANARLVFDGRILALSAAF